MEKRKLLMWSAGLFVLFLLFLTSNIIFFIDSLPRGIPPVSSSPSAPPPTYADRFDWISALVPIASAIGTLVTAVGTISTLILAWKADRRQKQEALTKEIEARLRIAELEAKVSILKGTPNDNG